MMKKSHKTLYKQAIIIRDDLKMNRGKIAAQSAHASWLALLNIAEYKNDSISIPLNDKTSDWFNNKFTKVVLEVSSEKELKNIYEKAKNNNLLASIVTDSGLTHFNYVPTITAVAIGPDYFEKIDSITKHLKSLK